MNLNPKNADIEVANEELGQFLQLTSGEIKVSIHEANGVIQTLTKTFMEMVSDVHEIQLAAEKLSDNVSDTKQKQQIIAKCKTYMDKVQAGTVGFQFYDKMSQRLRHTSGNLKKLKDMTEANDGISCKDSWQSLKYDIEKSYTMEEDRVLYKALMKGDSIKNAIQLAAEAQEKQQDTGNTELF